MIVTTLHHTGIDCYLSGPISIDKTPSFWQPVPIGVLGELYISGVGLARGYHHQPQKTAETFLPNPFAESCQRMYKTGDLAYYLPDGRIKLCGRVDNQVKIRGFRIELGEIEALLTQHPQVSASVVTVSENSTLVAYFVPESATEIHSYDLRGYLRDKLPTYMIPSALIALETLPLTPNGKIDYGALPNKDTLIDETREFVDPHTETEKQLAKIFIDVLEVEKLSIHDDFFELGGHSLLATKLIAQSLQTFEVELSVMDLFEAPNVAELAQRIEKSQVSGQTQGENKDAIEEREEIEF
jgi:acyl carrier protein